MAANEATSIGDGKSVLHLPGHLARLHQGLSVGERIKARLSPRPSRAWSAQRAVDLVVGAGFVVGRPRGKFAGDLLCERFRHDGRTGEWLRGNPYPGRHGHGQRGEKGEMGKDQPGCAHRQRVRGLGFLWAVWGDSTRSCLCRPCRFGRGSASDSFEMTGVVEANELRSGIEKQFADRAVVHHASPFPVVPI